MHHVDAAVDEARLDQLFPTPRGLRRSAALVHRGNQAELAGEAKIMQCHLERRIVWSENCEAERHESVAVGKRAREQPLDLASRMRHFRKMRLPRLRIGLRRAMEERRANAAVEQRPQGG